MDIGDAAGFGIQASTCDGNLHPRANPFPGTRLPWLAIRSTYRIDKAEPYGVAVLAFGVGREGASWLRELAASAGFVGLEPDGTDLRLAGAERACGYWARPNLVAARTGSSAGTSLPRSILATLAFPASATDADAEAALELVRLLRARRVCGRRPSVIVTSAAEPGARTEVLHRRLREAEAFVVTPWPGTPAAHLHGFPLRAAIEPRDGRLVCVDLADHLVTWPSGGAAILRLCDDMLAAHTALRENTGEVTSVIHWHAVSADAELDALDRLGQHATAADDVPMVITTAERIDGSCNTVDLLWRWHIEGSARTFTGGKPCLAHTP